jgi:CRP-like cAMP-binding protein
MKRFSKDGAFFGESCLARQTVRMESATALEDSTLVRIGTGAMILATLPRRREDSRAHSH